jgi:cytochrome c553
MCLLPRSRRQQPDSRQSEARWPDTGIPAQAVDQLQARSRQEAGARESDHDRDGGAAFYARQAPSPGAAKDKETLELGRKVWRGGDVSRGLPACAGCHGATGAGIPAQFPRLAGQYAEYTESQLKAFRASSRANDTNKTMRTIARKMTEEEISAVADYAAGLR